MKLFFLSIVFTVSAFAQNTIELGGKTVTFTNLQGRIFTNVILERANLDGVIYSLPDNAGLGMVKYANLSTNLLVEWKIPLDRIQIAEQRKAALVEHDKAVAEASRLAAIKAQQAAIIQAQADAKAKAQATADWIRVQQTIGTRNVNGERVGNNGLSH